MKRTVLLFLILNSLFLIPGRASAACTPVFGGGKTCEEKGNLVIDKQIEHPSSKVFIDSLTPSDPLYRPGTPVNFKITVTNTGNADITNAVITDVLPTQLTFSKGPGTYDAAKRELTIKVDKLAKSESKSYTISSTVVAADKLPLDRVCAANTATVKTRGAESSDNSQFCISKNGEETQKNMPQSPESPKMEPKQIPTETKGGIPVYTPPLTQEMPNTGPELLGIIALLPAGAVGIFLRRKSSGA